PYYRRRSWWRPALVAFNISFGNNICWYPLSYHHRDPHSRNYVRHDRLTPLRADELANLRRVNPAQLRAVTTVSSREFGSDTAKLTRANDVVARNVIGAEPLRGDLPLRPARSAALRNAEPNERTAARPARVSPGVHVTDRPTGAMDRTPGAPLDSELRRTR